MKKKTIRRYLITNNMPFLKKAYYKVSVLYNDTIKKQNKTNKQKNHFHLCFSNSAYYCK